MSGIKIVCTGQSHPRKTALIDEFVRDIDEHQPWDDDTPTPGAWHSVGPLRQKDPDPSSPDARVLAVSRSDEGTGLEEQYGRHRLHCCLCGLNVTVRKSKLDPVLTRLHAAGVSALTLSGLDASLRSSKAPY